MGAFSPRSAAALFGLALASAYVVASSIYLSGFAEIHLTLPFAGLPLFLGEILLGILLVLCLCLWGRDIPISQKIVVAGLSFGIFFAGKVLWGVTHWGPLALRHSALYYYSLIALSTYVLALRLPRINERFWFFLGILAVVFVGIGPVDEAYLFPVAALSAGLLLANKGKVPAWLIVGATFAIFSYTALTIHVRGVFVACGTSLLIVAIAALSSFKSISKTKVTLGALIILGLILSASAALMPRERWESLIKFGSLLRQVQEAEAIYQANKNIIALPKSVPVKLYESDSLRAKQKDAEKERLPDIKAKAQAKIATQKKKERSSLSNVAKALSLKTKPSVTVTPVLPAAPVSTTQPSSSEVSLSPQRSQSSLASLTSPAPLNNSSESSREILTPKAASVSQASSSNNSSESLPEASPPTKTDLPAPANLSTASKVPAPTNSKVSRRTAVSHVTTAAPVVSTAPVSAPSPSDDPVALAKRAEDSQGNLVWRVVANRDLLSQWLTTAPILGVSFGKPFRSPRIETMTVLSSWASGWWVGWVEPHNSWTHILYRSGVMGFVFIAMVLGLVIYQLRTAILFGSAAGFALAAANLYWCLLANFEVILEVPYYAIPFWIGLGLSLTHAVVLRRSLAETSSIPSTL